MVVPTLQNNTATSSTSYIWRLVPSGMWRWVVALIRADSHWTLLPPPLWQRVEAGSSKTSKLNYTASHPKRTITVVENTYFLYFTDNRQIYLQWLSLPIIRVMSRSRLGLAFASNTPPCGLRLRMADTSTSSNPINGDDLQRAVVQFGLSWV